MSCLMMISLGVYVLGAADSAERARVEAHLPGCQVCQAELVKLAPLPGLLASLPGEMRAPFHSPGRTTGRHAAARTPSRPARRWLAVAAAACVAAAAGSAGGFWLAATGAARPPASITLSGTNPALHVSATAVLTPTSWGTSIQIRLRGAPLNVPCRLIARSRTGGTEVTGIWDAWRDGPITVPASVGWRPSDIASLQIATTAKTLVTIAVTPHSTST